MRMLIWVVYESKLGNTAALAQAIAGELAREHRVRLMPIEEAGAPHGVDLLIIGCPHHRHHQPDGILAWAFKLPPRVLHGIRVAIFEIRSKRHYFWQGESSATLVWRRLQTLGGKPVMRPVSFYLHQRARLLPDTELERGAAWAKGLARKTLEGTPKAPFIHAGDQVWH
jgi:flavodoxin